MERRPTLQEILRAGQAATAPTAGMDPPDGKPKSRFHDGDEVPNPGLQHMVPKNKTSDKSIDGELFKARRRLAQLTPGKVVLPKHEAEVAELNARITMLKLQKAKGM